MIPTWFLNPMIESDFVDLEKLFLALGDKTRLRLLALMADGEVSVGFLAERLDESQPKVSRHLAYLRNAGVVYTRRDGKWIYYGISYPRDTSLRGILETVVQSVAVMRINGAYVYLTELDPYIEPILSPVGDVYMETDIFEREDEKEAVMTNEWSHEAAEMDVFLL
jgi:DNA-binding transcriptional ArsR family regulator